MSGSGSGASRQRSTLRHCKNRQPFKGLHVFSDQLVTFLLSSYLHCIQERLRQLPRTTTHLFSFVFILSSGIVSNSQNWNDESRRLLASKSLWLFPAAVGNASRKVILNSRWQTYCWRRRNRNTSFNHESAAPANDITEAFVSHSKSNVHD